MRRVFAVAAVELRRRFRSRTTFAVAALALLFGSAAVGDGATVLYRTAPNTEQAANYAAEQTAAMVGLEAGLTATYSLLIAGFFFLSGSLNYDRDSGVDQLAATTPVSSVCILLGKWVAHVSLVSVLLAVAALGATFSHAGGSLASANPVAVFGGVFLLGLPAGAFVSGVTLLFESTDRLSGTAGSVVYFVGLVGFLALLLQDYRGEATVVPLAVGAVDLFGNMAVYQLTIDSVRTVAPEYARGSPGFYTTLLGTPRDTAATFQYKGGPVPQWVLLHRSGLVVGGALLSVVAALPYDRWDPDTGGTSLWTRLRALVSRDSETSEPSPPPSAREVETTPVDSRDADRFVRLVGLELRRMLRGRRWWWYLGVVVLLGLTPVATQLPRQRYVAAALVWPVFVWASMGVESSHGPIRTVVHSSDQSTRQFAAEWLAGVLVTVIVAVPPILAAGQSFGAAVAAGAVTLFVPSAALATGLWTGSSRVFELGYLVLWYLGPLNIPELGYGGATEQSLQMGTPIVFLVAAPFVVVLAYLGRRRLLGQRG